MIFPLKSSDGFIYAAEEAGFSVSQQDYTENSLQAFHGRVEWIQIMRLKHIFFCTVYIRKLDLEEGVQWK